MTASPVFANISPKSIKVTEKYQYYVEPLKSPIARPIPSSKGKPSGEWEVITPYDGGSNFTEAQWRAIQRQWAHPWWRPLGRMFRRWVRWLTGAAPDGATDRMVRIGYLAFGDYHNTDLRTRLQLGIEHDTIQLDLPVECADLPPGAIFRNQHHCRILETYEPTYPDDSPIRLEVQIQDEHELPCSPEQWWQKLAPTTEPGQASLITIGVSEEQMFHQPSHFIPGLHVSIRLTVACPVSAPEPPQVTQLAFAWPKLLPRQRFQLAYLNQTGEFKTAQAQPVTYDPEISIGTAKGALTWGNIPLSVAKPPLDAADSQIYYESPWMRLEIQPGGELYQEAELCGQVRLKLSAPLSNVQLAFFDATGRPGKVAPAYESQITLNFVVDTAHCLEAKRYTPQQTWHFDQVQLDLERVADVQTALQDLGFMVRSAQLMQNGLPHPQYMVLARQPAGADTLWLWMLMEGHTTSARRQRVIPGDQVFTSEIPTGDLVLRIRGQVAGEHTVLLERLNELQERLKYLFQQTAIFH